MWATAKGIEHTILMSFGQVSIYRRLYGSTFFLFTFFACQLFRFGYQCIVVDSSQLHRFHDIQFCIGIYCDQQRNGNKLSDREWWLHYFTIYHSFLLLSNSYLDCLFQHWQAFFSSVFFCIVSVRSAFVASRVHFHLKTDCSITR